MSEDVQTPEQPAVEQTPAQPVETTAPSFRDTFKSKVGDEAFASFEKYGDDDSFVNGILSAQSMIGKKGDIPAEDATPEQRKEFWDKLGGADIKLAVPELGEEFGDLAAELTETYGGITQRIQEIAAEEYGKAANLPELIQSVMGRYLQEDALAVKQGQADNAAQTQEQFNKLAVEVGLAPEALKSTVEGVMAKYGWDSNTSVTKALYTLAKETAESTTLKDAVLTNTQEGLDAQIAEISASDEYLRQEGPQHDLAIEKLKKLWDKKLELEKG